MHASIGRYLKRHRQQLADAIARPLERALGPERASREAAELVAGLERALLDPTLGRFLGVLRERLDGWAAAGVESRGLSDAMLALARSPAVVAGETAVHDWLRDLKSLLEFVPTPMVLVDPEFRVVSANAAFHEMNAEPPETLTGLALHELFDAESAGAALAFENTQDASQGLLHLGRVRLRTRPEREMLASRVPFSPNGTTAGWFVTLAPDASQLLAEASLAEMLEREKRQNQKFAALLTVSHAVTNTLELNTILTTIAREVREVIQTDECTVFLYDEREQVLVPQVCDARTYVDEMLSVRLKLGEGITGGVALSGKGEIVNDAEADPRAMTVPGTEPEQSALLCVPLLGHDRVIGVITLSRFGRGGFLQEDLELATLFAGQCSAAIVNARLYENQTRAFEELRKTQTQLVQSAKLNALGEMAGGVAHDFNNILAAILGRTQLLMQTFDDPEIRRQLGVIEQAALDGAHTVRRVQEFTRVRADEHFATLDVNQVLLGVIELTRPAWESGAKRRGIGIDVHLELRATQPTAGNASELREVFTNLVLNAVDAMPSGGELWVSSENGPEVVRVQVRDTGVGMDGETRARIFDPFFTTKAVKGTGLGLSVAYGIVSRHRGTIDVESEPGVGTVFTLTLPVGEVADPVALVDPLQPLPPLRVLVVDDEDAVLEVLSDLLGAMGMDVLPAHGGRAGLEALDREPFDVVFTDLGMPDVNGWDLAIAVESRHPGTAVVLATGWGFQLEEDTAASRGVDLVMPKPFSFEDVERALRHVLPRIGRLAA